MSVQSFVALVYNIALMDRMMAFYVKEFSRCLEWKLVL